jgi:transposase-like protein
MANLSKSQLLDESRIRRQNRYFSTEFKQKRVKEIEQGLVSIAEISREYEVSRRAIYKWIYKYSMNRKKQVKQVIEALSDTRKIQELKKKIKELEQVIGQKQVELEFKEKMIELAEEHYGIDIKKKLGSKPSFTIGETDKETDQ